MLSSLPKNGRLWKQTSSSTSTPLHFSHSTFSLQSYPIPHIAIVTPLKCDAHDIRFDKQTQ